MELGQPLTQKGTSHKAGYFESKIAIYFCVDTEKNYTLHPHFLQSHLIINSSTEVYLSLGCTNPRIAEQRLARPQIERGFFGGCSFSLSNSKLTFKILISAHIKWEYTQLFLVDQG